MNPIDPAQLSARYAVRRMTHADEPQIYALMLENTQYFAYCGKQLSREQCSRDLEVTPPGVPQARKFYLGFFDGDALVAVMDLIDGYPEPEIAFVGFFMMCAARQGKGEGTRLVSEVFDVLRRRGMTAVRLGIDKGNPQSTHFWKKNGFTILREQEMPDGVLLYAERKL